MKKFINFQFLLLTTIFILSPFAPSLSYASGEYYNVSQSRVSSEDMWSSVYGSYAYDPAFPVEFLKSAHVNPSEETKKNLYHISAGSFICNSPKAVTDFINKTRSNGEIYTATHPKGVAYPGCFYLYKKKAAVYQVGSKKIDGLDVIEIKFTLANQPPWRFGFYDNASGHYAIYHGYSADILMSNKLHWDDFINKDKERFKSKQEHIMHINSMPDENNRYPIK